MQTVKNITIYTLSLLVLVGLGGISATKVYAVDASEIQQRCQNITPQQRQMAKAAGYDVDSLCSQARNSAKNSQPTQDVQTVVPRNSSVTTNDRGVIESAQFQSKSNQTQLPASDDKTLKPYGYDLFAGVPTTFAPVTNIPIPVDYVVGPGDSFQVDLLGKLSQSHELRVNRDGKINFPELGPIAVAGLKFSEAKQLISERVNQQMIGVRAIVTLGELRSIRVFILGEAHQPGSYTVSSLSTITNALFVSGGVKEIGSLRNIQLKRNGKTVTTLDLYDLLQRGDTSNDVRLLPGDVIFIPPVGKTAAIEGEVKRPAIYELTQQDSLKELIKIAGGYSAEAYPNISHITRKNKKGFTTVVDVDLSEQKLGQTRLNNGDRVKISTVLEELENVVTLSGTFHRPRSVQWSKGLKLSDLITSVKDFKEDTDLNIALVVRKEMPLRQISVLHFELNALLAGDKSQDLELQPMDEVMTFSWYSLKKLSSFEKELNELEQKKEKVKMLERLEYEESKGSLVLEAGEAEKKSDELIELVKNKSPRSRVLDPLVKKLKEQNHNGGLVNLVDISGNIRFPGTYPLTEGMTVRDLILLAGGLKEASYLGNAEITRRDLTSQETATIAHINVNLLEELTNVKNFELQPKDKLAVYATPEYSDNLAITLEGEVRFPGLYEFKRGETLSQVIARAGGFTSMAHIQASVFTREDLKQREQKQLDDLKARMREDIAASELENAEAGKGGAIQDAEKLLNALSNTEALGRLVISLEDIMTGTSQDLQLRDGDRLIVPTFRQEISVVGEVQHSTSHIFSNEWTLDDYLESSGGMTSRADDDRIYVVRADGSVFLPNQSGWLSHQNEMLQAGDTIVVPLDTDRIKSLTLWTNVSQIVYQLALGAAAINNLK
ncbi:SLBB domain-containing protein [Aliikangiella sp. IMCC44632]